MTAGPASYAFHFRPAHGWMNDPNGLIEHRGVHHLFFQYNPTEATFGRMYWGHATSTDLVTWTEQPLALTPGEPGDYDRDGCWSGCAVATPDGQVVLIYSAHREGRDLSAVARSDAADLAHWTKAPDNPVIADWPPVPELTDLRDPAVSRTQTSWRQVLAGGRDSLINGWRDGNVEQPGWGGLLVTYVCESDELTRWRFDGVLLDGATMGLPGEVWECPDLFEVEPGLAVVILSWYTRTSDDPTSHAHDVLWLTGALHDGRFTPNRYGRLDLGDRLYAPQSYATADGRRILFGWLRTQQDPASAGHPSVGAATLPRVLQVVDGRLTQRPAAEVDRLPRAPLGRLDGDHPTLELREPVSALELTVTPAEAGDLAAASVELTGPDGHVMVISLAALADGSTWVHGTSGWLVEAAASSSARLLVDAGLVELFTDDGRAAATSDVALSAVSRISISRSPAAARVEVSAVGAAS